MDHKCPCIGCEEENFYHDMKMCSICSQFACLECISTHYGDLWCRICWDIELEERGDGEE